MNHPADTAYFKKLDNDQRRELAEERAAELITEALLTGMSLSAITKQNKVVTLDSSDLLEKIDVKALVNAYMCAKKGMKELASDALVEIIEEAANEVGEKYADLFCDLEFNWEREVERSEAMEDR